MRDGRRGFRYLFAQARSDGTTTRRAFIAPDPVPIGTTFFAEISSCEVLITAYVRLGMTASASPYRMRSPEHSDRVGDHTGSGAPGQSQAR